MIFFSFNDGYITYRKPDLLITTRGVFCYLVDHNEKSFIDWAEIDFVASSDLARDDATFRAERDPEALEKCMRPRQFTWPALMIVWGFIVLLAVRSYLSFNHGDFDDGMWKATTTAIAVLLSPALFFAVRRTLFWLARLDIRRKLNSNPLYQNVLYINHIERVDVGVTLWADGIIQCLKLGLTIYRMQQEKYG